MTVRARIQRMSRRPLKGFQPQRLLDARLDLGLSQGAVALRAKNLRLDGRPESARISPSAISTWERGQAFPQVDSLYRVAAVLGLRMDEVIVVPEAEQTLATVRELAGWTQPQLAAMVGISTGLLSQIELGYAPISTAVAESLARALDIEPAALETAYRRAQDEQLGR